MLTRVWAEGDAERFDTVRVIRYTDDDSCDLTGATDFEGRTHRFCDLVLVIFQVFESACNHLPSAQTINHPMLVRGSYVPCPLPWPV